MLKNKIIYRVLLIMILFGIFGIANSATNVKDSVNNLKSIPDRGVFGDVISTIFDTEGKIKNQYLDVPILPLCIGSGKGLQFENDTWNCIDVETYTWNTGNWSSCSAVCGGGTQSRTLTCTADSDNALVDNSFCDQNNQPISIKSCNSDACVWSYNNNWSSCSGGRYWSGYGGCSKVCGSGIQGRSCVGSAGSQKDIAVCKSALGVVVDNSNCVGSPPEKTQVCNATCSGSSSRWCNTHTCRYSVTHLCSPRYIPPVYCAPNVAVSCTQCGGSNYYSTASGLSYCNENIDWMRNNSWKHPTNSSYDAYTFWSVVSCSAY